MFIVITFVSKGFCFALMCHDYVKATGSREGNGPKTNLQEPDVDPDEKVVVGVVI